MPAEIEAAEQAGERNLAINLAVAAFQRGARHPRVLVLLAEGLEAQNRPQEALALLERAVAATPGDAGARFALGRLLMRLDRREEARAMLEAGLEIVPRDYRGRIDAGTACLRLAALTAAREHFLAASQIRPGEAEPLSAMAVVASLTEDTAEARAMAQAALNLAPELISAQIALARADAAQGEHLAVEERLAPLLGRDDLSDPQRIDIHDRRADSLDASGRPAQAFAAYQMRNEAQKRLHGPAVAASYSETSADRVRRLTTYFRSAPADPWRTSPGPDLRGAALTGGHVFLVGFPRSGTTLLEKVLASHPGVNTLEETDLLAKAGGRLLSSTDHLNHLAVLPAPEAGERRGAYWKGVREALSEDFAGRIVVDKLPLHTPSLPVIAKLFPAARILFAIRDPRDVVLSCFRRRFRINAAMYEFLTLEGAAAYYDAIMTLADIYRAKLPLTLREVRHEAVVADFDEEIGQVLGFVGADWNPAVKDFADRAAASVKTPSAPQLALGLNAKGVGQWRRYRDQIAPVLPVLAPWVARFGYEPD